MYTTQHITHFAYSIRSVNLYSVFLSCGQYSGWTARRKSYIPNEPYTERTTRRKDPMPNGFSGLVFLALSAGVFFGVKKGRLFERSEFLPFSRREHRSSQKSAALILSFWFFFFRIKTKEKELFSKHRIPSRKSDRLLFQHLESFFRCIFRFYY